MLQIVHLQHAMFVKLVFVALFDLYRAALRQGMLSSFRYTVCASGGTLFYAKKCGKSVKGTPLKTPFYGGAQNRLVILHNGTPSKKTSCVCPARTLLHISSTVSSFASGCLLRRSSLQDTCKTRHTTAKAEFFSENRRSVRAGQTIRLFRSARAVNRSYADHLL